MIIKTNINELIINGYLEEVSRFIIKDKKELEKCIRNNMDIELSEEQAYVMGIVNSVQTNKLTYKLREYLYEYLSNNSFISNDDLFITKSKISHEILNFKNKYPISFIESYPEWKKPVMKLYDYIDELLTKIENMNYENLELSYKVSKCINSKELKKIIKLTYVFHK